MMGASAFDNLFYCIPKFVICIILYYLWGAHARRIYVSYIYIHLYCSLLYYYSVLILCEIEKSKI